MLFKMKSIKCSIAFHAMEKHLCLDDSGIFVFFLSAKTSPQAATGPNGYVDVCPLEQCVTPHFVQNWDNQLINGDL